MRIEHSLEIYSLLSKNESNIQHTPFGLRLARFGGKMGKSNITTIHNKVNDRIQELIKGVEDEL